jgi:hypothetical protein
MIGIHVAENPRGSLVDKIIKVLNKPL